MGKRRNCTADDLRRNSRFGPGQAACLRAGESGYLITKLLCIGEQGVSDITHLIRYLGSPEVPTSHML